MSLIFYRPSTPTWSQAPFKINLLKTNFSKLSEKSFCLPTTYTRYIVRNHKHQNLPQLVSFWHHLKTSMPPALLASPALKSRAATKPAEPCSQIWALETVSPLGVSCLEPGYLKGHYRTFPKLKCFVFFGFFWGGGRCSLRKSPLVVLMDSSSTPNSLILWQHPLMNGNFKSIQLATDGGRCF